jgi:hypothetical protein
MRGSSKRTALPKEARKE